MTYYVSLAIFLFVYMTLWFGVSRVVDRNDVADIAWGLGFVVLAIFALILSGFSASGVFVTAVVAIWGFRLAWHIYSRNRNKPEDARYAVWRKEWRRWFIFRSYVQVFLLQGIFLFAIEQPVLAIIRFAGPLSLWHILGLVVWSIGFYFESLADWQLSEFVRNPAHKGHIMNQGVWGFSRHPNYFGEVTQWWGIFCMSAGVPGALWTIVGPLTITGLICFVSGIPLLEKKYHGRPDFEEYKKRTSVFLPMPPLS